jgi:hypothetical protein
LGRIREGAEMRLMLFVLQIIGEYIELLESVA